MSRFLFVPSVARGNGSGHLVRCLTLARELSNLPGSSAAVFLDEDPGPGSRGAREIEAAFPDRVRGLSLVRSRAEAETGNWDFVVLDLRRASREEELAWRALAPTVALDEGGPAALGASFRIDALPRTGREALHGDANLASRGFLHLPGRRRDSPPDRFGNILLAFGGEDPRGLGPATARALVDGGFFRPESLTLLSGPLGDGASRVPRGVLLAGPVPDLKETLASYDLVFTQFGLTAFEAAWAGCAVILVDPGRYHARLSRSAGFPAAGIGRPEPRALVRLLSDPAALAAASAAAAPERAESLAGRLAALRPGASGYCPVCGVRERAVLERYPRKSYFRCAGCGMVYRELFEGGDNPYVESYFFEEYRRQYGRTYLEDFPALTAFAAGRLEILEGLLPREAGGRRPVILDVGCAYGAFLAEAARRGWDARGLDIAPSAAAYVRDTLGLRARAGDFLDPGTRSDLGGPVDCLSMWFVIEHFEDLARALRAAADLVRPGGIFAFSTPSGGGISASSDPGRFFDRSPDDHATVWEPRRAAGILGPFGFRVERIRVTGHHPERFPGALGKPGAVRMAGAASRLFGLGDTFECYARRVRDSERED